MQNSESLTGIAEGLQALAKSISQAPGILKTAYQAGFIDGAIASAIVLLVLGFLFWRNRP